MTYSIVARDKETGELGVAVQSHYFQVGPVVPMHIRGAFQIMPRGQRLPLPGPIRVRIGKPMTPQPKEGSRDFTARVEGAVRALATGPKQPALQGTWIERWRAAKPRVPRYGD